MVKKRMKIRIYGRVQGVSYRFEARTMARYLGVKGLVKNMADGSVYAEAEAGEKALGGFVSWCRKGPDFARVERVETEEMPVQGDDVFDIKL
ncbi:MAG: acylphosphatase [Marinilabiliales bacterium]|nr:MAG: acylphosphatase [Marinilabiliales bacterium]